MPDVTGAVPDTHRDLLDAPLTATLTTVDAHGRPQSTAVARTPGCSSNRTGDTLSPQSDIQGPAAGFNRVGI